MVEVGSIGVQSHGNNALDQDSPWQNKSSGVMITYHLVVF